MIVVEGPDGSGKSTALAALGYSGVKIRALRGGIGASKSDGSCADTQAVAGWALEQDEAPTAYARAMLQVLRRPAAVVADNPPVAFDRFHLSEIVYGPMLRGESAITLNEAQVLHRLLLAYGIHVLLCMPSVEATLANVQEPGRERPSFQTESFLREAYQRFRDLIVLGLVTDVFDFQCEPKGPRLTPLKHCPPGVIGSPYATYLVVDHRPDALGLPAFSMTGGSGFLNTSLWIAGFHEDQTAFTTAEMPDGSPRDLRAILQAMPSVRQVILLGLAASSHDEIRHLEGTSIPCERLPSPAVWAERYPDDHGAYASRLRGCHR